MLSILRPKKTTDIHAGDPADATLSDGRDLMSPLVPGMATHRDIWALVKRNKAQREGRTDPKHRVGQGYVKLLKVET